jgi:thioredoxin reductase
MRAEPINLKRLEESDKITIKYNSEVKEFIGEKGLDGLKLNDDSELKVTGLFVEIGHLIQSELAEKIGVKLNEHKEIIIDVDSKTNVPGVYAAGDVGCRRFKQAITGAAEGVVAAFSAFEYLKKLEDGEDVDVGWH